MSSIKPYISSGYEVSTWYDWQIYKDADSFVEGTSNFVVPSVGDLIITIANGESTTEQVLTVASAADDYALTTLTITPQSVEEGLVDLTTADLDNVANVLMRVTTTPVIAAIHSGLIIQSSEELSYAKIFTGINVNDDDSIVSRIYDTDDVVIGNEIPLVKDPINNFSYTTSTFNLDRILEDKSYGTIVVYGSDDTPVGKYTILFREMDHLVDFGDSDLYITGLELETTMMNPMDGTEILVKKGFLNSTFSPRVYKVYNTGQREEVSLQSRNLKIEGWGNFIIGQENDTFDLSLIYTLADNEQADVVSGETTNTISANYTIRVVDDSDSVNFKAYPVLAWDTDAQSYTMRMYMYDSTYKTNVDVTDSIQLSNELSGTNFVDTQIISYSISLKDIGLTTDESYDSGSFAIALRSVPMGATTPFDIYMVPTDTERYYGFALRTRLVNELGAYSVQIDSDYTSYEEWLDNVYYKLLPVYDKSTNVQAPAPTHVDVTIDGNTVTLKLSNTWNIGVAWDNVIPTGEHTAELQWYSYDSEGDINYLAISSMQLEYV